MPALNLLRINKQRATELIALLAFVLIVTSGAWLSARHPRPFPSSAEAEASVAARPPTPPPAVEPLVVADVAPEDARAINAKVAFRPELIVAARPFNLTGGGVERERAIACLAAAVLYEAGDDANGQRPVAQVVLNRVRHPAFPKSVCGVVFQGSERATGCQFTFMCDGSLGRSYSNAAWARARAIASRALSGSVDARVGTATHYHTDWVVPYWSASLDKLAAVDTHLFFRWRGWWGTRAAFTGRYSGVESLDRRLAFLVPEDAKALAAQGLTADQPITANLSKEALRGSTARLVDEARSTYVLQLDPKAFPGSYAQSALSICRGKPDCTVLGWAKAGLVPTKLPITPAMRQSVSFMYQKRASAELGVPLWNCRQFKRPERKQCIPGTDPPEALPAPPASSVAAGAAPL